MVESSTDVFVHGIDTDAQTRCAHWHSPLDIIAIKFKCCGEWYSCYECHKAIAGHDPTAWHSEEFGEGAILCGACQSQLTINEYLTSASEWPRCSAKFNPGCARHYDLYFEV